MGLEIDFYEGHPVMQVGAHAMLRVRQRDADGALTSVSVADVAFEFAPVVWGRVVPTGDPGVGCLEVMQLADSGDVLLEPTYSISASLSRQGGHTFKPRRQIRVVPTALEIELSFEVGRDGQFEQFMIHDLSQPIDWSQARVTDPSSQTIVMREGVPYLRMTGGLDAFPMRVDLTFPNGEVASLTLEGNLTAREHKDSGSDRHSTVRLEQPVVSLLEAPTPVAAPAEPPAGSLRDQLTRLQRYVDSFGGAGNSDSPGAERIRQRITDRIEAVRPQVDAYAGPDKTELAALFDEVRAEGLPSTS